MKKIFIVFTTILLLCVAFTACDRDLQNGESLWNDTATSDTATYNGNEEKSTDNETADSSTDTSNSKVNNEWTSNY